MVLINQLVMVTNLTRILIKGVLLQLSLLEVNLINPHIIIFI